jgi:hypothetical protein
MIEPLYRSASPIWTTTPSQSPGFAFQSPSTLLGGASTISSGPGDAFSAMPAQAYVPIASMMPTFSSGLNLATASPFAAAAPTVLVGPESMTGVTAPALLGAVAVRRGQPQGPTNDQEVEDFIYDALESLSGASEVEIRCDGGRATLTGNVHHKRIKRDVGEIAWAIPGLQDVQNNVTITSRRRARAASREPEAQPSPQARK